MIDSNRPPLVTEGYDEPVYIPPPPAPKPNPYHSGVRCESCGGLDMTHHLDCPERGPGWV